MKVGLIITVKKEYLSDLKSIVEKLEKEGVSITKSTGYGIITGKGEKSQIKKLSRNKEFESVIEDGFTQLPPPGSKITW